MLERLAGKVTFITGSSAGIGEATANLFAKHNAKLILTARRFEKLEELKKSILETINPNAEIHIAKMDVTCENDVKKVINTLPPSFTPIDVLVNNAGLALGVETVESVSLETYNTMMDTNVKGLLLVTQSVLPLIKQNPRGGHVINVSSVAGTQAYPGGSIYCASKHAVHAISNALRMELVASPIKVSTISPGLVETEFSKVRFRGDNERANKVYQGLVPLSGIDIAENIAFVASRPDHVQIADILVFPNNQAAATLVHREN